MNSRGRRQMLIWPSLAREPIEAEYHAPRVQSFSFSDEGAVPRLWPAFFPEAAVTLHRSISQLSARKRYRHRFSRAKMMFLSYVYGVVDRGCNWGGIPDEARHFVLFFRRHPDDCFRLEVGG